MVMAQQEMRIVVLWLGSLVLILLGNGGGSSAAPLNSNAVVVRTPSDAGGGSGSSVVVSGVTSTTSSGAGGSSPSIGAHYHQNHFQQQQALLNNRLLGPASMQYMAMNHDGQYSFAYSGSDSARQERRHPDGSVHGKYSYTNPDGKLVHVEYSADSKNGFNAIGDSLPTNNLYGQQHQFNSVVQDTPAVRDARERFFETYARELARVNAAAVQAPPQPHSAPPQHQQPMQHPPLSNVEHHTQSFSSGAVTANSIASPTGSVGSTTHMVTSSNEQNVVPPPPPSPSSLSAQGTKVYSVAGFDSNSYQNLHSPGSTGQFVSSGNSQYSFNDYNNRPVNHNNNNPAYFYYVGVGGMPYYVTAPPASPVRNTNIAVSVRAQQLGAIPADAVHDAQVPRYEFSSSSGGVHSSQATPPVYVEYGKDYTLPVTTAVTKSTSSNIQTQQQQPLVTFHQAQTTSSTSGSGDNRSVTASHSATSALPGGTTAVAGIQDGNVQLVQHYQQQQSPINFQGSSASSSAGAFSGTGNNGPFFHHNYYQSPFFTTMPYYGNYGSYHTSSYMY